MNYSFFQVCLPKEVFIDRPHLRSLFNSLALIAAPVPFIGSRPADSKEYFCFAVSVEGLQTDCYSHFVRELNEVVVDCRRNLMLFAYALLCKADHPADDMYVRFDTASFPHMVEHCLTFPCLQLDRTTFLLRMKPLEFESWHQRCLAEQVDHPHSVSTGISAFEIQNDATAVTLSFLREPGGLRSAVFQLRPLQGCTAALQISFRTELELAVKQQWPCSFGYQWSTASAPSGFLVQVMLLRLPVHNNTHFLEQVGTTFHFLQTGFVLELHRQGYALPSVVHFDLPEEETAAAHRVNLPANCEKQALHLTTQSKGRALSFVPQHSDDRAARRIASCLAKHCKTIGREGVFYSQAVCKESELAVSAVYAGFVPLEVHADHDVPQVFRATETAETAKQHVSKHLTSAMTQLYKLLPRSWRHGSSTAVLKIVVVGPHTLLCKRPSSTTNIGAVALHDILHTTLLVPATNVKCLSVLLASGKACSVTIELPSAPEKPSHKRSQRTETNTKDTRSTTDGENKDTQPPAFTVLSAPPSSPDEVKGSPPAPTAPPLVTQHPIHAHTVTTDMQARDKDARQPNGATESPTDNGPTRAGTPPALQEKKALAPSTDAVEHRQTPTAESTVSNLGQATDPVDIPVCPEDGDDDVLMQTALDSEDRLSDATPATQVQTGPLLACALFVALRMLSFLKWNKVDANDSLDWHLLHLVSHDALQTQTDLREAILSLTDLLFPGTADFFFQNRVARTQDAIETYDKLCSRLLQKHYAFTTGIRTLTCLACGCVQNLDFPCCVLPYDVYANKLEHKSTYSETLLQLFQHGFRDPKAVTCPCCNEVTAHETDRLACVADLLVLQVDNHPYPHDEIVTFETPVTSTRGSAVRSLVWCASVLYDDTPGAGHYVLLQKRAEAPHELVVYDPLKGLVDPAHYASYRKCAHLLSATYAHEACERGTVPPGSVKLSVIMTHLKRSSAKLWQGTRTTKRRGAGKNAKRTTAVSTAAKCRLPDAASTRRRVTRSQVQSQDLAGNYGLISLFDGLSTASYTLAKHTGTLPGAILLAESDAILRSFVSDVLCISPHVPDWQLDAQGVPTCYANDVWSLFDEQAVRVKQFISLLGPHDKIIVVAGSPCQDATVRGSSGGLLGFTGPRSYHVHAVCFLLHVLDSLGVLDRVFLILENAGSMLGMHKQHLSDIFGLSTKQVKPLNASSWSCVARNRLWLTSSVGVKLPAQQASPFAAGWSPLCRPAGKSYEVCTLAPWLRCQKVTHLANPVRTSSAYHFENLLFHLPRFGGAEGLARLVASGKLQQELLSQIPPVFRDAWQCMQSPKSSRYDTKQVDAAAFELADLFEHPDIVMPMRLPSLLEQIQESELHDLLHKSPLFAAGKVGEVNLLNFLGNYFKPSALIAAVSQDNSQSDLDAFLHCKTRLAPVLKPTPLSTIERKYHGLADEVRKDPRFKRLQFSTQAAAPCPPSSSFLLKEDYYAQLRLFSKVAAPIPRPCNRYKHTAFELTSLLARQSPVYRQLPLLEDGNAALHASVLAAQQAFPITFANRTMIPDPSDLLTGLSECHGSSFVEALVKEVIESFSRCTSLDTAMIILAPHLGVRRVLGKCFRVRSLSALVCNSREVSLIFLASSFLPYEHPSTCRIATRISEVVNSLHTLLLPEADVLAFKAQHACPPFLSVERLHAHNVHSALLHLPHLSGKTVLFTGQDGHFHFNASSADAAHRLMSNSATAVASEKSHNGATVQRTFANNFIDALQQLVVRSSLPSVACSFVLEQPFCPDPQSLEEVLLHATHQGKAMQFRFHSIAVSPHIKVFDFLEAVSSTEIATCSAQWQVFVHFVCRYSSQEQVVPATLATKTDIAGLRKLPHLVSSLITAGIGEAHPT